MVVAVCIRVALHSAAWPYYGDVRASCACACVQCAFVAIATVCVYKATPDDGRLRTGPVGGVAGGRVTRVGGGTGCRLRVDTGMGAAVAAIRRAGIAIVGICLTWDSWHTIIMAQKHLECSPLKGVALEA